MKKILSLALFIALTIQTSYAATNFGSTLKNAIKEDVQAVKDAFKRDVENETTNKWSEQNAGKRREIIKERNEKLREVNADIREKQAQIREVKYSDSSETAKTIKLRIYERQLEGLQNKKERINERYRSKLRLL